MRISQTEHNIKKALSSREITPSQNLWDNIQEQLDKEQKPKSKKIWIKYASIAAILCLAFLAYQNLTNTRALELPVVIETKPIINTPMQIESIQIEPLVTEVVSNTNASNEIDIKKNKVTLENTLAQNAKVVSQNASESTLIEESEADKLLRLASAQLAEIEAEQNITEEVNALLSQAINNTDDVTQKNILKDMGAVMLLAEVESDIKLQKPDKLKDKIWEALVSNLKDIKNSVVYN